jgi:hypothetical protein
MLTQTGSHELAQVYRILELMRLVMHRLWGH